jgi:hypothetical protein
MVKNYLLYGMLSLLSGWLYRRGGSDKSWHGKERDWGCPLCLLTCLFWLTSKQVTVVTLLAYIATGLTSWGALSTYWKKGEDCKWHHWALHGLFCGLAALPMIWCGINMFSILYRSLFLAVTYTTVSEFSENVVYEEMMRGFLFTASVIFLV